MAASEQAISAARRRRPDMKKPRSCFGIEPLRRTVGRSLRGSVSCWYFPDGNPATACPDSMARKVRLGDRHLTRPDRTVYVHWTTSFPVYRYDTTDLRQKHG